MNDIAGLLGCLLLIIALPLKYLKRSEHSRFTVIATILIMTVIAFVPISGLIILAYIRGVVSDLSITSMILLGIFIASTYSGKEYLSTANRQAVGMIILLAAIILYPFALGLGPWDSYAAGYGSTWFYTLLSITAVILLILQRLLLAWILLAGITAYLLSLLASQNLWDYLIDPVLVFVTLYHVLNAVVRRQTLQRNQPTRNEKN